MQVCIVNPSIHAFIVFVQWGSSPRVKHTRSYIPPSAAKSSSNNRHVLRMLRTHILGDGDDGVVWAQMDGKASTRDKMSVDTQNSVEKMEKRVGGDDRRRDSHDDKMRSAREYRKRDRGDQHYERREERRSSRDDRRRDRRDRHHRDERWDDRGRSSRKRSRGV